MEQASLAANATPNVVVVSAVPGSATLPAGTAANVIFTTANMAPATGIPVSVVSGLNQPVLTSSLTAAEQLSTVTVDLNAAAAAAAAAAGQQASPAAVAEDTNGGVLLCNLDELSRLVLNSLR